MSKANWACFPCRRAQRASDYQGDARPRCLECGRECAWLGRKLRVPPRKDVRDWKALEDAWRTHRIELLEERRVERVRWLHELERRRVELLTLPDNPERSRLIRELEARIGALSGAE